MAREHFGRSVNNTDQLDYVKRLVEFNDLTPSQKWRYLESYGSIARRFYGFKEGPVVPDDEVYRRIKMFKQKPQPKVRRIIALKDWRWRLDRELNGRREGYFKHGFADESWEKTTLPHNVNYVPENPLEFGTIDYRYYNAPFFDKPMTVYLGEYAIWYRTPVSVAKQELEGKKAFLKFESCSIKTTVWLDEWPVILEHYGVYPFEVEITEEITKSKWSEKEIVLEVRSTPSNTPDFFYNCLEYTYAEKRGSEIFESLPLNWGGVNGAVELVLTSPIYIKNFFIYTKEIERNRATLHVKLEIENTTKDLFKGVVQLDIKSWYPEEERGERRFFIDALAKPLSTTVVEEEIEIPDPALWGVWRPNLYMVHATLSSGSVACDDIFETFGVRTFIAKDGKFFLNGEPIILSATHDQGMYPNTSPTCPDDYWIVQDFLLHKALGMVSARYPSDNRVHYRRIAEYADQMGIMLIWEGYCSLWLQHPDIEHLARRDIPMMIRDLGNHPSIIIWVLGDETFLASIYQNKRLRYYQLVHDLVTDNDPSRVMLPVGNWADDLADVIERYMNQGLELKEARIRALELLPVFASQNVYWDVHKLPSGLNTEPVYAIMEKYHRLLCGTRWPVAFDEFGAEGMPNWELCREEWWYKRWTINPSVPLGKKFIEPVLIGKEFTTDDWPLSQAHQALVHWRVLSYIRESGAFAGFSTAVLRDCLNFYMGLVDHRGRGKLVFFLDRSMLQPLFISAMHGNFSYKRQDDLSITVSNSGPMLKDGKLTIKVTNEKGGTVEEKTITGLTLPQGLTHGLSYEIQHLPSGLYAFEYRLYDGKGNEAGCSLDMFFIE